MSWEPSRVPSFVPRALPFVLGFFLVANGTVTSAAGGTVRMTDLFALVMAAALVVRSARSGLGWRPLAATGVVVALPVVWSGLAWFGAADRETLSLGIRWLLAVPWALVLVSMMHREPDRTRFVKGLAVGCGFNALVVVAQYFGVDGPLQRLGFSSFGERLIWVGEQVRLPGLHGAPSSSAAVISLVAPATLWLYLRDRASILWPVVGYAAAAVGLHLTSSRSPLLMVGLSTLLALGVTLTRRRALGLWAFGLAVALPVLLVVGPPGGWARWTDTGDTMVNVSDRWLSNVTAFELTLQHPLGMGVEDGRRALFTDTGIQATHNAWLQAALFFGIPVALAILFGFALDLWRLRYGWRSTAFWPALVTFHLCGLFLFEEHLNNPTFVILTVWLVTEAVMARQTAPPQSARA